MNLLSAQTPLLNSTFSIITDQKTIDKPDKLVQKSSREPMIGRFLHFYHDNRDAIKDLFIVLILTVLTYVVLVKINFTEKFYEFSRKHEIFNLDEIVATLSFVLMIYLPYFTIRRWQESVKRLRMAKTDSLTEINNRRKGWEDLELEISRAKRYHRPLSVMLFDIDWFKEINDTHGHLVGDEVLRLIANQVQNNLRAQDIFVRWGGEEFVIISSDTNHKNAIQLAERLRKAIQSYTFLDKICLTASFGVTEYQENDLPKDLIQRADEKMYAAKLAGRNRVK
jgi:diguanylate cyclase (GGDEF)-like protein